jgi:hypothetical protein
MRKMFLILLGAALPAVLAAQAPQGGCTHRGSAADLAKRASPLDSVQATIDGATVTVCYGRPSAKGRAIMGGLVPFGTPWRLGANEPTRLILPFAAEVAGARVEPGTELGTRATFADVGQTLAELFGLPSLPFGASFLAELVGASPRP